MGSPISGITIGNILATNVRNIFRKFEIKIQYTMISRYVDDVLIIYNDNTYNEEATNRRDVTILQFENDPKRIEAIEEI